MMLMLSGCIGEIVTAGQQQRHLEATDDQVMMARLLAQSTHRAPVGLSAPAGGFDGGLERRGLEGPAQTASLQKVLLWEHGRAPQLQGRLHRRQVREGSGAGR